MIVIFNIAKSVVLNLAKYIVQNDPNLTRILRIAKIKYGSQDFVERGIKSALMISFMILIILFFMFDKFGVPMFFLLLVFPLLFTFTFLFILQTPYGTIRMREREINKEILFAGRYLLVKMESGNPLFNTLIDASKSYGICSKYFEEIVEDINTGTPIEEALEKSREYNASSKFKRILWQIITSLKTGVDIAKPIKATLRAITREQILEIKAYAKKLNSLMMFYMIIAGVIPSIGVTMLIIMSGFLQLEIRFVHLLVLLFMLAIVQFSFLSLIRSMRPMVNL